MVWRADPSDSLTPGDVDRFECLLDGPVTNNTVPALWNVSCGGELGGAVADRQPTHALLDDDVLAVDVNGQRTAE